MLYPPIDSKRTIPFPALKKAGVYKNGSRPCMYYVSGAGWFTINGMCHIRISTPNGVGISAVKVDFCQ
jgi:hypothetical protein